MGVLFRLVWPKIEGTDLDGFDSIYQGHLFFQKDTYAHVPFSFLDHCSSRSWLRGCRVRASASGAPWTWAAARGSAAAPCGGERRWIASRAWTCRPVGAFWKGEASHLGIVDIRVGDIFSQSARGTQLGDSVVFMIILAKVAGSP